MKRASASATMTPLRFSFLRSTWDLPRKTKDPCWCPPTAETVRPWQQVTRVQVNLHRVQDGAAQLRFVVSHARQRKTGQPAQAVALVLPGHGGLAQVDLLVHQRRPHPGESGGNHLEGRTGWASGVRGSRRLQRLRFRSLPPPVFGGRSAWGCRASEGGTRA